MLSERASHVIAGMGEIGSAFYSILKDSGANVVGWDVEDEKCKGVFPESADIVHICFPCKNQEDFINYVKGYWCRYNPKEIIIHSSVTPGTTQELFRVYRDDCVVAYSPWRGIHSRMTEDMKRYVKYYAFFTQKPSLFVEEMAKAGFNIRPWNDVPNSLELAKLLEVTYYGWLIIWAQHKKLLADRFGVDDEKLWQFTDEVHEVLGNRPRMFAGEGIGGHCVMQDKDLLNDSFLDSVFSHDLYYRRNLNGR